MAHKADPLIFRSFLSVSVLFSSVGSDIGGVWVSDLPFSSPTQKNLLNWNIKYLELHLFSCQKITRLHATKPEFIYSGALKFCPTNTSRSQKQASAAIFNHPCSKWNTVKIFFFFFLLGAILLLENPRWEKFPCFMSTGKARMTYYILDFTTPTNKKEARNQVSRPHFDLCFLSSNNRCLFTAPALGSQ